MEMLDDLMVQQQIHTVWEHMVGVICLNQTHRKQVKRVLPEFFKKWPDHKSVLRSRICNLEIALNELGMSKIRAKRIYRMSKDFCNWDGNDATKLYGIGKYGSDSYEIFFKHNYNICPTDKELKRYLNEIKGC
jgi:endonuclease III